MLAEHGAGISEAAFRQGLAAARWPARFEVVKTKPLTIIDGAHNLSGAEALARTVEQYLPAGRLLLVVGVLADKDVNGILRVLLPCLQGGCHQARQPPRRCSKGRSCPAKAFGGRYAGGAGYRPSRR